MLNIVHADTLLATRNVVALCLQLPLIGAVPYKLLQRLVLARDKLMSLPMHRSCAYIPTAHYSFTYLEAFASGIFIAVLLSHGMVCCLATNVIARLQKLCITVNIWYALSGICLSRGC